MNKKLILLLLISVADPLSRGMITEVVIQLAARREGSKGL